MNILLDIGHPGHVYLFKNLAANIEDRGQRVYFTVKKNKKITELMDAFGLNYMFLGRKYNGLFVKYLMTSLHLLRMGCFIRSKGIKTGVGISGLISFASQYSKMNSICLDDDDISVTPVFARSIRNADTILTPSALEHEKRGKNHISYDGYHELAYLHPNQFKPDPSVLKKMGVKDGEQFFLLRFNAFRAHHDVGEYGLNMKQKQQLIKFLETHGRVFISSEKDNNEFPNHKLNIPPEKIHSVIYYATMLIGDSQTMTSEAAVLGIPALKCNTFARRLSVPNELEDKYGLCYSFRPDEFDLMLDKIDKLLKQPDLQAEFQSRRQKMLADKIDVTAFMAWFIENYPKSTDILKRDLNYQDRFKYMIPPTPNENG